jgi:hypothetical protein
MAKSNVYDNLKEHLDSRKGMIDFYKRRLEEMARNVYQTTATYECSIKILKEGIMKCEQDLQEAIEALGPLEAADAKSPA